MKTLPIALSLFCFSFNFSISYSQQVFVDEAKAPLSYYASFVGAINGDFFIAYKTTLNSNGDYNIYCARIHQSGRVLWEKTYGTSKSELQTQICPTKDNGMAMFGQIYNDSTKKNDAFIIKCDSLGNIIWSKQFKLPSTNYNFYSSQILEDDNGNYLLMYLLEPHGLYQETKIQIIKIDALGNMIFQSGAGHLYDARESQYFYADCISEAANGEIIIGLDYECSFCQNGPRGYVLRLNNKGKITSYKSANPVSTSFWDYNVPLSLFSKNGETYMLGFYYDNNKYTQHLPYNFFYWVTFNKQTESTIAKLIPYNAIALHRFLSENNIRFQNLAGLVNSNKNIAAVSYKPEGTSANKSIVITSYDSLGRTCSDSITNDYTYDTSSRAFNFGAEILGGTNSIDTITITNLAIETSDIHVMHTRCSGSSLASKGINNSFNNSGKFLFSDKIKIYPNPVSDYLIVTGLEFSNSNIIYVADITGKILQRLTTKEQTVRLNLNRLLPGTYLIKIETTNGSITKKFVRQ